MPCPLASFCSLLTQQLGNLGVDRDGVDTTCTGTFPCAAILDNSRTLFQNVDQQNASDLSEFVARLFQQNAIDYTDTSVDCLLGQQPFRCPELEIEIYQPCQVKSCSFWTANAWTRNCILEYRVNHTTDLLEVKDLAFLLGLGLAGTRQLLTDAIASARYWALKNKISAVEDQVDQAPPQEVDLLESPIEEAVRARFGLAPARVLLIASTSFASLKSAAQAVDVPVDKFLSLCQQHGVAVAHLIS